MGDESKIVTSLDVLNKNLESTAQVAEWARLTGYHCPKKFARQFLRQYEVRPQSYLKFVRLKNISKDLRVGRTKNFDIARKYGIPDEIALNKFINYHLGCSPTDIKCMSQEQLEEKLEKFGSKVR